MTLRVTGLDVQPDNAPVEYDTKLGQFLGRRGDELPDQNYPSVKGFEFNKGDALPDQNNQLRDIYDATAHTNPDEAAKIRTLAEKANSDPNYVQANISNFQAADKAPNAAIWDQIHQKAEKTADFLSDPQNMAVTHDDVPNLAFHEMAVNKIKDTFQAGKNSIMQTLLGEELAFQVYGLNNTEAKPATEAAPPEQGKFPDLISGANQKTILPERLGSVLADKIGLSRDPAQRILEIRNILAGIETQKPKGFAAGAAYSALGLAEQSVSGELYSLKYGLPIATGVAGLTALTGAGLPAIGAAAFSGVQAGSVPGQTEYNYRLFTGQAIDRLSQMRDSNGQKLQDNVVKILGAMNGAANASLGVLQLGKILETIPGGKQVLAKFTSETTEAVLGNVVTRSQALKNFAYNMAKSALHGAWTFGGMEAINVATEEAAKTGTDIPNIEPKAAVARIATSAIEGAGTMGILGSFGHGSQAITDMYQANRTKDAQEFYTAIGPTAEANKLRERMPEKYKEYLANVTKDGPVEHIYVPRDDFNQYWQSQKVDPAKAAAEIGVSEQYAESQATGSDVKIPLANYTDKLVGTKHWEGLKNDVKFSNDALTVNEADRRDTERRAETSKQFNQSEPPPPDFNIAHDFSEKAVQAGRGKVEADALGKLHENFFGILGNVLGIDSNDLYKKYSPEITQGGSEASSVIGKELSQGERGGISLGAKNVITLLKGADKSTLLHESAHLFLEAHRDALDILDKATDHTPEQKQFLQDSGALKEFLGVQTLDNLPVEKHEQFARAWEQYLREGVAPSQGLRKVFQKFSKWLTNIYANSQALNVELNPEVREVFARMLATQEQIKSAKAESGFIDNQVAQEAHPIDAAKLESLQEEATARAEEILMRDQMKETTAEHKAFLKSEKDRLTINAVDEVRKNVPVFKAQDEILAAFHTKKDVQSLANSLLDGKLSHEETAVFDAIAQENGFLGSKDGEKFLSPAEDLAKNILIAERNKLFEHEVSHYVEDGMSQHAGLLDPEVLHEHALETIHGEKQSELLAMEAQVLEDLTQKDPEIRKELSKKRKQQAVIDADAAKDQAQRLLAHMKTRDAIDARRFVTAERNAAVRVSKAIAAKDFMAAATAKREQMLNHALAAEASRDRKSYNKSIDKLAEISSRGKDLLKMPYGYTRQIDQLLMSAGLKEVTVEDNATNQKNAASMKLAGSDNFEIANATGQIEDGQGGWKPEGLGEMVDRVNRDYWVFAVPESVLKGVPDHKDMTLEQFNDFKTTIGILQEKGKSENAFLALNEKRDIQIVQAEAASKIAENTGLPFQGAYKKGSKYEKAWRQKIDAISTIPTDFITQNLVTLLPLCEFLDRGDPQGPMKNFVYRILSEAGDKELRTQEKVYDDLRAIHEKYFAPGEFADLKTKMVYVEGSDRFGEYVSMNDILHLGLNRGSESNMDRATVGFRLSEAQIDKALENLSEKHWKYIQDTWNHIDTFWPESKALEMRVRGIEPEKVVAQKFMTKFGEMEGGYYPLGYDHETSIEAYSNANERNALFRQFSAAKASTKHGFLEGRVAYLDRPLRLEHDVLVNHLKDVIHDQTFREAVIDVSRFMNGKNLRSAIQDAAGLGALKSIDSALKSVAAGQNDFLSPWDKGANKLRSAVTTATLAFRIKMLPLDFVGNSINTIDEIGITKYKQAMSDFAKETARASAITASNFAKGDFTVEHNEISKFVQEKSIRMKFRGEMKERDFRELAQLWKGDDGKLSGLKKYAFVFQVAADEAVSIPLWHETYKNAVGEHGEEAAIHMADEMITKVIGSGDVLDLAQVQRGSGMKKLMTMYYSWSGMMFNRMWLDGKMAGIAADEVGNLKASAIVAKSLLFGWGLHSLSENVFKEAFRNTQGPADEESRKKRIIARTLQQPASYVPFVRDVADAFGNIYQHGTQGQIFSLTPAEAGMENVIRGMAKVPTLVGLGDRPATLKDAEQSARAMAIILKYPQEINNYAFNFLDWMNDNGDATWRDLLTRRTKK